MKTVTLTLNNVTDVTTSDAKGMFDIHGIWKHWMNGQRKSSVGEFARSDHGKYMIEHGHMQVVDKKIVDSLGRPNRIKAFVGDSDALIAYCMWCDVEFMRIVLKAFVHMGRRELNEAQAVAGQVLKVHNAKGICLF